MVELDSIIHEKSRLEIMSYLLVNEEVSFKFLKERTQMTDGNLAQHLRKLEDAKYIEVKKGFKGRRPQTKYRITEKGIKALNNYLKNLKAFIEEIEKDKTKGG